MSEGTQSGEYWAKDGPYGQAIQQLSAKSAGLRQSPLAEPFRQQLSPADRLSQEIVANRYLQSIALLDSLLIALVKEATESFELDVQSMNLPEKARQFVAGEISMPGTIPLLSAASSGNTLCEACAVYAGPSLSFQTNELRSMRLAISRRIDRALNFSASWIGCNSAESIEVTQRDD